MPATFRPSVDALARKRRTPPSPVRRDRAPWRSSRPVYGHLSRVLVGPVWALGHQPESREADRPRSAALSRRVGKHGTSQRLKLEQKDRRRQSALYPVAGPARGQRVLEGVTVTALCRGRQWSKTRPMVRLLFDSRQTLATPRWQYWHVYLSRVKLWRLVVEVR